MVTTRRIIIGTAAVIVLLLMWAFYMDPLGGLFLIAMLVVTAVPVALVSGISYAAYSALGDTSK